MKSIALILTAAMVTFSGCAGFHFSAWIGYRKIPPEVSSSILHSIKTLPAPMRMALTPAQIEFILSFLNSESFEKLIEAGLPANNRVDLGGGINIFVDKQKY